ncbi:hypothetical protein LSCM1_02403 [Leishmania martiniquensis]|uniref:Uncharacterized protein n=1 Tax=Leishmania martiniquensis TaxID=1580590 RepID=A0A836GR38_9TRYP|nr:hypothetical protein LSCM1_02403 [Leishmania martiniquensis]
MNGARRFSAAPVNFDRFIVLARSYSRSLSPDKELDQMLRPFEGRATTTTNTATRESTASRVRTPPPRPPTLCRDELACKELVATQVLRGKPYGGVTRSALATLGTAADKTLFSTRATTSMSRNASGCAAETPSVIFAGSSDSANGGFPVGEETQELGSSTYSVDDVDPLLRAVLQLGSPLYDPVKRQFVCWRLHRLEKRPRTAYGSVDGVSCDFCGHTDWLEKGERASNPPPMSASLVTAKEEEEGAKSRLVVVPSPARSRCFYHCSACLADICWACLEEIRSDERFHIPCLKCQRCGGCETRQNAPMHRCTELMLISDDDDEGEVSAGVQPLPAPRGRHADASEAPPTTPPLLSPPASLTRAPPKHKGVPIGSPVRLGLSRRHRQAAKEQAAPVPVEAAQPERSASSAPHQKRKRASPGTTAVTKPRIEKEAYARADTYPLGDASDETHRPLRQVSAGAVPRLAPSRQKEEDISDGDESRNPVEAAVPPFARYEVYITPRTAEEVSEVGRIAREQHLVCSTAPSLARVSAFYFATRLAAETCVDRASMASLEAILKRNVKHVCRTFPSPHPF